MDKCVYVAATLVFLIYMSASLADSQHQGESIETFQDSSGNYVSIKYVPVGCFRDSASRTLRNMYYNARLKDLDWNTYPNFSKLIHACTREAYLRGYRRMFGIQFWGECWSDGSVESRFTLLGKSDNCENGVGKSWANFVYRITGVQRTENKQCHANGVDYNEGQTMLIPNEWVHPKDAKCLKCECSGGTAQDCTDYAYCDLYIAGACEKFATKPGECCPHCACSHNGQAMSVGSTWVVRQDSKCSECTCSSGNVASCVYSYCVPCVGDPVAVPGKCCPKCVPRITTSAPIVITTQPNLPPRPPPTLPPPPPWAKKRNNVRQA